MMLDHDKELARYKRDMRIVNSILAGCAIALVVLLVWF